MAIYPLALQRPGPPEKRGYPGSLASAGDGVVCHSMAGSAAGGMAVLDDRDRRASWHFSVLLDGTVLQHYDSAEITWHSGSRGWNTRLIGIEHEGGFDPADEPLTPPQLASSAALVRWLAREHGFAMRRRDGLWEHREVAPLFDPTSCPSGRIPWQHYERSRMYTDEEIDAKAGELLRELVALGRKIDELGRVLTAAVVDHNRRLVLLEARTHENRP